MGILNIFGKKQSEQELYWEKNPDELHQIEESGKLKLSELNALSSKIETSIDVNDIVEIKDSCLPILDWFAILDKRQCPYHINDGAETFKVNLLKRCNIAIVNANKTKSEDFFNARDSLCKDVDNYELCLKDIAFQARKSEFYGTPKRWIDIAKNMFYQNQSKSLLSTYIECGLPEKIAYSKDSNLISSSTPFEKGSNDESIFKTYVFAVKERYNLQFYPLLQIENKEYNLNLPTNEIIYHRINLTTLYEEKVVRYNVSYSGIRWTNGLLRAGTISAISNEIKDFTPQDIGRLFITNKRIIFVGAQRNITKAINIKDVILYNLYQDGILINQVNKKAILFKFDQTVDYGIYSIGDGLNEFIITLNRIISGTENDDLEKNELK